MDLGTVYVSTKFWPDQTSNMVAILEDQLRAITPELFIGWISSKF
jgi:hypothetical protein